MNAFLEPSSFEGFRAYSLDTLTRLDEAISLGQDVLAKRVAASVLPVIFEELAWSITSDRAALAIAPRECELVVSSCPAADLNTREKIDLLRLLKLRIQPAYFQRLRDELVECVNDEKKRIPLLASTGFLASHLINQGHSRGFLIDRLNDRFFSKQMKKVGASIVRVFINGLANDRGVYRVIHGIDENIERFLIGKAEWEVNQREDFPEFLRGQFDIWPSGRRFKKFATRTLSAPDPFRAASQSDSELERLKAFTLIPSFSVPAAWSRECVAHRPRGTTARSLMRGVRPLQSPASSADGANFRLRQLVALFNKMEASFDEQSRERLSRALAAAHVATKTTQDEARLLSLWSAFEVLLSEPDAGDVRILHFVKHLVPCIAIKYHRRAFAAVQGELHRAYKTELNPILWSAALSGKGRPYDRFAKLIVDPQYTAELTALFALCADNPLALHRLFRLHKYYGTPKDALATIKDHSNRVRWQLHRIYRVRNSLVHAGKAPEYVDTLVTNSLEYFRSCITNLTLVASRHEQPANLDLTISEISLEWSLLMKRLAERGTRPFDDELAYFAFRAL